ncbi:MAG: hypothetical protein OEZ51_13115 [Nitrospinota bacterium]|nr:hypothetical protein [Nitrospinota bacterium]
MSDFKPLFPQDAKRTEQFRRVIIRKTLQLARENPKMDDDQIIDLVDLEAVRICDLCVESSYEDDPSNRVSQYFMDERVGQRRNHVGRFFVFALEGYLNEPIIKRAIYRVLAGSTEEFLGRKIYESYSQKIKQLLKEGSSQGLSYNKVMEQKPSRDLTREILQLYWNKMEQSVSCEKMLKNQIDSALTKYQTQKPEDAFDIEAYTQEVYDYFMTALKKNLDSGVS